MKILKTQFRKNGLDYTLLRGTDKVALYGIVGTYTDEILNWGVDIIYIRKDQYGVSVEKPVSLATFSRSNLTTSGLW